MKLVLVLITAGFLTLALWRVDTAGITFSPPCELRFRAHHNSIKWTLDGSHILFDIGMALYVVDADGSRLRQLADGWPDEGDWSTFPTPANASMYADVSPDNSRIVYSTCWYLTRETGPGRLYDKTKEWVQYEIATSNIDGTEPRRLTHNKNFDHFPVWSPDGTRIIFISSSHLYTMAADGSDVQSIAPDIIAGRHLPRWSPDGQRIAFVGREREERGRAIYTVRPDGSDLTRISDTLGDPSWSPDGERIAFIKSREDDEVALYTIASDGSDSRLVTVLDRPALPSGYQPPLRSPIWSPSGSEILVDCTTVCVVSVEDGSIVGQSPILLHGGDVAAWSPDGSRVAVLMAEQYTYDYYPNGSIVLYTMAPDGTDLRVLVRGGLALVAENSGWQDTAVAVASCSEGYVVSQPEKNPGLVEDCKTLMRIREAVFSDNIWSAYDPNLGVLPDEYRYSIGNVVVNWSPGTPMEQWVGVTIEEVCGLASSPWMGKCMTYVYPDLFQWTFWEYPSILTPTAPRVTGLYFAVQDMHPYTFLAGTAPAELGKLAHLKTLDLSKYVELGGPHGYPSYLQGGIPRELGQLRDLEVLRLSFKLLTGDMPAELGSLKNLRELDLSNNGLSGSLPPELGNLPGLRVLRLDGNQLSGDIPPELGNLTELQELRLDDNQLTGRVPMELTRIPSLGELGLSENLLECMPSELKYKASLQLSYLDEVEVCIADSYTFQVSEIAPDGATVGAVRLADTEMASYSITSGNEDGLFAIDSASGEITVAGPLDSDVAPSYLLAVEGRDRKGGRTLGSVAISVLSLPDICSSTGVVVPEPGDNPGLVSDCAALLAAKASLGWEYLDLDVNWRTNIPITSWRGVAVGGSPSRVQTLDLTTMGLGLGIRYASGYSYPLPGNIALALEGLTGLWGLDLGGKGLTGGVPPWLKNLHGLESLYLSHNELTGEIPTELSELSNLRKLDLSYNELTGTIPPELESLSNLRELRLGGNKLIGCIPSALRDIESNDLDSLGLLYCE